MLGIIKSRIIQGYRTTSYPKGTAPELPKRFAGRPTIDYDKCRRDCGCKCAEVCPTAAIRFLNNDSDAPVLDIGRCIFCNACQRVCAPAAIKFDRDHHLAAAKREDLVIEQDNALLAVPVSNQKIKKIFGRSIKLRQVSAGGCNACEADTNVLNTVSWDLARFGIDFVASPRHADGLLVTGPVSTNMKEALLKTYEAIASPKIVIAVGACAISGGPYIDHQEVCNGIADILPVDLFIPGCPPHPLTILDGLLRITGRLENCVPPI